MRKNNILRFCVGILAVMGITYIYSMVLLTVAPDASPILHFMGAVIIGCFGILPFLPEN